MLHIELAHPHRPANRSEGCACWERAGYKYDVTTTAFVCVHRRVTESLPGGDGGEEGGEEEDNEMGT